MLYRRDRPRGLGKRARLVTIPLRRLLRFLAFIKFIDTTVINREVVPKKGAVIIAANHTSFLDIVFLWGALRRQGVAIAMAELWGWPIVGWLAKVLGQIPVVRGDANSGRLATDAARKVLEHDGLFIIFPEGSLVSPGETKPYKPGVARLSLETKVPIIPVGVIGANKVLPIRRDLTGRKKFFREEKVQVRFGLPIDPRHFSNEADLLKEVERRITQLASSV